MQIVDLSLPLEDDRSWSPWWARTRVRRQGHRFGRFAMWLLCGVRSKHLRTGLGWANDTIKMSTHGSTHVDAPWHYAPTSEGKPALSIDEIPLDWFHGPGVVVDVRDNKDGLVSEEELRRLLADVGHEIRPGDVVLVQTGNDRLWGSSDYFYRGPGVGPAATRWLMEQGVRLVGIDAWGWDGPLGPQAEAAKRTGRKDVFWASHYVGVDRQYCQIERLANLDQLPRAGFTVSAFPLKVRGGSAGPARVVAMLED